MQDLWQTYYQNLSIISLKEFMKSKVNTDMIVKNVKCVELNTKIVSAVLNTQMLKYTYVYAVTEITKKSLKSFKKAQNLKKQFANTYKFSKHDINKFISLLPKSVYLYQSMNDWAKFNETSLHEKLDFYSHLGILQTS